MKIYSVDYSFFGMRSLRNYAWLRCLPI